MTKPKLFIFTGANQVTGALKSGFNLASTLVDVADVSLILSTRATPSAADWPDTPIILLPLARAGKTLGSILAYPAALLRSGWHLRRELKRAECDRLQINDFHFAEGAIVRLLGYRGRIVTWVRIDPKRYGIIGRIWLGLARWSSDELVVVSKFIAGRLPPGYRSTLIYDAVPPVLENARTDRQCLLFVGNYIEGKGQDDAIRAFHRIAAKFPRAELLCHGSDMGLAKNRDYRESLELLAEQGAGKGRIHLGDFVKNPDLIYRQAYAVINCSHSESFSLTCLEGSAYGLAVLATRCGGPEEIVDDGITGFLVPVGDIAAMAARMSDLLGNSARAAAMGEAGRQLVGQRFSTASFRTRLRRVFDLN